MRRRNNPCIYPPGGSTIEGVKVFQEEHLEETAVRAYEKAYLRNKELGKK